MIGSGEGGRPSQDTSLVASRGLDRDSGCTGIVCLQGPQPPVCAAPEAKIARANSAAWVSDEVLSRDTLALTG